MVLFVGRAQEVPRVSARVDLMQRVLSEGVSRDEGTTHKCATPLFILAASQLQTLPALTRKVFAESAARFQQQKSRLSPSGRFRIHYDTTGVHTPALLSSAGDPIPGSHEAYIDSVARYFDFSWSKIVEELEYSPPPADGTAGGGPEYDVYVEDLPAGIFGVTTLESEISGGGLHKKYSSSIAVDNDFRFTRTRGLDGLKITAGHEFFHAVQLGGYGVWAKESNPEDISRDFYFYELSSVWMEDILFPEVDDYLNDLPDYFTAFRDPQNRSYSFTVFNFTYQGYERSLWAYFLAKKFGRNILREVWTALNDAPFLESMDRVLTEKGSSLAEAFAIFSQWNYFTGERADTVRYYPEGYLYPLLRPNTTTTYSATSSTVVVFSGFPLSTQYCLLTGSADSTLVVVTNVDGQSAGQNNALAKTFELQLAVSVPIPYQLLSNGLQAGFTAATLSDWRVLYIQSETKSNAAVNTEPYPNPIRTDEVSHVSLPVSTTASEAEVFMLSSSLDMVFSGKYSVSDNLGKRYIHVPTRDFKASVNSGIYFIVVHGPDRDQRWKVAVIR